MANYEFHEAANIFPMDDENLEELAKDIGGKSGLLAPIELYDGKILDGRRRYMACKMAGVAPAFCDVSPDDPVAYVLSLNLHRRHLTASQRAMVAGRARDMYDAAAKERQAEGQERGRKSKAGALVENLPPSKCEKARDQAGKAVGVSGKLVDNASKVLKQAHPDVAKAVDEGRLSVSRAAELAAEDEDTQRQQAAAAKFSGGRFRKAKPEPQSSPNGQKDKKGVGITRAWEAIDCLKRIPKNDGLRAAGFKMVFDWIRKHK